MERSSTQSVRTIGACGVARGAASVVERLDRTLHRELGAPEATLGNHPDPMDEAVYLILAAQTDVPRARLTWARLVRAFPTWEAVESARANRLAAVLQPGGLHRQKARAIRRLLRDVSHAFGRPSLDSLRSLDDAQAEKALLRLHGMSWKSARCVMLYSLGRSVFPVDVNTFRIFKRIGILRPRAVYRRRTLHDALQNLVPAGLRHRFHVNLVLHGQRICRPVAPLCTSCCARAFCAMAGSASSRATKRPPSTSSPDARRDLVVSEF